ncbi:MAG: outer membrane beta-barrel protein, partial [Bacteroidales bacterium]|nr:outer membrane beta-barrel protein [Bacteroidales bacterium]
LLTAFLLTLTIAINAQTGQLTGTVVSENGDPLTFATIVLLNPSDSTLEYFGISNQSGDYVIRNIRPGKYLMQYAFVGYEVIYRDMTIPRKEGSALGITIMKPKPVNVGQVNVIGEYIPLQIRKDTLEFNAKAFKTSPDANVEELLKKLPGIQVDRAGNVKALGETVRKVFVDGKEFFGNDPKVATRNIPADAVSKVQVFDKKSEESEFTGIDDGTRNKAINLVLDEDKKNALFGDAEAGWGTAGHYRGNVKAFRFTDKIQLAGLAMQNNINQAGFSFSDYMNFKGGLGSMMKSGGSININMTGMDNFPLDFGQQVTGLTTSGAGGVNFSFSPTKKRRFFISYLGNGNKKNLEQKTKTWNYLSNKDYFQQEDLDEIKRDTAHRINLGIRYRFDSTRNLFVDGNISLVQGFRNSSSHTATSVNDTSYNQLDNSTLQRSNRLTASGTGSYVRMFNRDRSVLKLSTNGSFNRELTELQWTNGAVYYQPPVSINSTQFQNNHTNRISYGAGLLLTQKITNKIFLISGLIAGNREEWLDRIQGTPEPNDAIIDSLSPSFHSYYRWIRPQLVFKRNTNQLQFKLTMQAEISRFATRLWDDPELKQPYFYLTPELFVDYEYRTGHRLTFIYSSTVNTPSTTQLLPVVNNINPLSLYYGNPELKPEYRHSANFHWLLFDQFSLTSLFTMISATYTQDKINWSRTVNDQLEQIVTLINVKDDYQVNGRIDFSTPIRKLGMIINLSLDENWNRGLNRINGINNINTNFSHGLTLSVNNRKKVKWDINGGASVSLTDARYSVQKALNNLYYNISWFADLKYFPDDHWHFTVTTDVTSYNSMSFNESVNIPLLGAEISYSFLKNNRGMLILQGFDLLNKNTGLQRISELNYLRERKSNIIGRYFMLSFKYRLNKFNKKPGGGIDIKMKKH